jgi:hypothetical protein
MLVGLLQMSNDVAGGSAVHVVDEGTIFMTNLVWSFEN